MADVTSLRRKRGGIKKRLTDFEKIVNEVSTSDKVITRQDIIEIETRLKVVSETLHLFYDLNEQIEVAEPDGTDAERVSFENAYFNITAQAKLLIENYNTNVNITQAPINNAMPVESMIKLPTLNLPKFKGSHIYIGLNSGTHMTP
jgi:hypothetical protein